MTSDVNTDGACSGNPGIGGWGVVLLIDNNQPIHLNGGSLNTTNNQMELTAAIEALKFLSEASSINLFTDSKYLKDGIELWIKNWKKNNWMTSKKKPVKNKDLWTSLDTQIQRHKINWKWIKGHMGHRHNEYADYLARKFIKECQ